MKRRGTIKTIFSQLTVSLVFLLLTMPAGSAWSRTISRSSDYPVLSTTHKKAPVIEKSGRELAAQEERQQIAPKPFQTVSHSSSKRKPQHYTAPALHPLSRRISAKSAIIMDAKSGGTIFALSPDLPRQPASTIKILTGLISIQDLESKELVPVSRRAAAMPRSKIYLGRGSSYPADDLINAVLLASANDASVALAEKIGGSERAFAGLMTEKARQLGAMNTICKSASGLTVKGQQTTARDLAIIFNQAMKNEDFARRMGNTKAKTKDGKILRNHNRALWQITGSEGGKTGYTWAARQTYVGKFRRGNRELLVAIMGSRDMWNDIKKLVDYGFADNSVTLASAPTPSAAASLAGAEDSTLVIITDNKKIARL